jgi:hypothetical protein
MLLPVVALLLSAALLLLAALLLVALLSLCCRHANPPSCHAADGLVLPGTKC